MVLDATKSSYDKFWVELLIWPFIGIFKFGPWIWIVSSKSISWLGKLTLKASGSFNVVTTHNSLFKSNSGGRGSYNFTKTVGSVGFSLSNCILLDISKSLFPKFK